VCSQYTKLNSSGVFAREEVLQAMQQSCGEEEAARDLLHAAVLQPFLLRVWQDGAGGGGEGGAGLLRQMRMSEVSYQSVATSVISHPDFQQTIADSSIDREVNKTNKIFLSYLYW
jgi:hypothetical protein